VSGVCRRRIDNLDQVLVTIGEHEVSISGTQLSRQQATLSRHPKPQ
jgi:hypothetical protein